jgi:hypothetical protein
VKVSEYLSQREIGTAPNIEMRTKREDESPTDPRLKTAGGFKSRGSAMAFNMSDEK